MHQMIRAALASTVVLTLAACAKSEQPAKDTSAAMAAPAAAPAPAAPAPIALADVAGKWSIKAWPASGPDTSVTTAVLTATADTTGWALTLPSGKVVKHHVQVSGDSLLVKSEPYPSMRRKGKTVWTEAVYHLKDGKLVGTTVGHYSQSGADSVLTLKAEGTKQ